MEFAGGQTRQRTVFSCVRRVGDGVIGYELVLPAARLLGAEPLLADDACGLPAGGVVSTAGLRVAVSRPLAFDEIDAVRGFGLVTIPHGTRLGFDGRPEVRHGMVRVTIVAVLPGTVWRLDEPLVPATV